MKAIILAGGVGTRISEESHARPKPMIEIGGKPILWHIMKSYSYGGINDFIVCCGYKGYLIKEYFANYFLHTSDVTFDIVANKMEIHEKHTEPWRVTLIDTGDQTMTGGRLKKVKRYLSDSDFCMTYGDGLSDINISELIKFHQLHGKSATVTAVQPPGRFGALKLSGSNVERFQEKPQGDDAFINGGFFVLNPNVLDLIDGDDSIWESAPLESLASKGELQAYVHHGFWQAMDTLRDKSYLEDLWATGNAPWKKW
jgi:glucose-1-phosphate cytidylyltransferase